MSIPVFERVTLSASNDTGNGGVAAVSCYSDPIEVDGAECLSAQITVYSIWGAGTGNPPKLTVVAEYSANGVDFGSGVAINELAALIAAGTKAGPPVTQPCGGVVRLLASFVLDGTGTTGPGAVTFSGWISTAAPAV